MQINILSTLNESLRSLFSVRKIIPNPDDNECAFIVIPSFPSFRQPCRMCGLVSHILIFNLQKRMLL